MGYKIRGNKIYVFGTVQGKFYRLSTGKEATQLNIKWIAKNHRDVLLKLIDKDKPKKTMLLSEYGTKSLEANAYSRKASTQKGYASMFSKHIIPYFKHFSINEIMPSDIKSFQSKLLKSLDPKTVKNIRIVLSTILNDAVMDKLIDQNPIEFVKPPRAKIKEDITPFVLSEVKAIIKSSDEWMRSFVTVAFFTGMRTGELLALKWEDINFNSKKIHVRRAIHQGVEDTTKSGNDRIIDMLQPVEYALKEKFKDNGLAYGYIFTNRLGKPYTESGQIIKSKWKPTLKRCAISYRNLYNTRHTFATLMLLNNEDVLWVSKMLGHSDVSTTMRYYVKFMEEASVKRASFLEGFFSKDCTNIAQLKSIQADIA